ncbi:MAG: lasso peptide biosynthesis B2 protein [Oscillochloris sp.]|nr:lasso peptide biosynthesis B2 protein [Oscillochloris sp.]
MIRGLRQFLAMSRSRQLLLLQALLLVGMIRLGLVTLRFQKVRELIERLAQPSPKGRARPAPGAIANAVVQAAHSIPGATCLPQALATRAFMSRHRYPCELRIGVMRNTHGAFEAHAWVVYEGQILIGGPTEHVARFTPLPIDSRI